MSRAYKVVATLVYAYFILSIILTIAYASIGSVFIIFFAYGNSVTPSQWVTFGQSLTNIIANSWFPWAWVTRLFAVSLVFMAAWFLLRLISDFTGPINWERDFDEVVDKLMGRKPKSTSG